MKTSEAFPSKYLKAADLQGREITLTMSHVVIEELTDGKKKPVLFFRKAQKGLVLNVTNSKKIADTYGDEMDDWGGSQIILYSRMVDFQGNEVEAIRIKIPAVPASKERVKTPAPPPEEPDETPASRVAGSAKTPVDMDDEIPF